MSHPQPKLLVASSKAELPSVLCNEIVARASAAIDERNSFSIALSGGSLPKFLAKLPESFEEQKIDPRWDSWHVFLADERCVPSDHEDSNLKAIKGHFLDAPGVGVPAAQIYGIDDALVAKLGDETGDDADATTEVIAVGYEGAMRAVLPSESSLDLAVLGFGPDGHTCSLFPDHPLLGLKSDRWVASIVDSPKPPPRRITLTMRFLNELTRDIIVCGAGASKQPIIDKVFVLGEEEDYYSKAEDGTCRTVLPTLASPPPYPCSMVTPSASLTWVVDHDAMVGDQN